MKKHTFKDFVNALLMDDFVAKTAKTFSKLGLDPKVIPYYHI